MLTLPASHSRAELELARRVARSFQSEDLHVFWSENPVPPRGRQPEPPVFGVAIAAIGSFFDSLTSTLTNLGRAAARS
jgi:hypothetical protein